MQPSDAPRDEEHPVSVTFDQEMMRVTLKDGREIATPLSWYPRLQDATPEQRSQYSLSATGIHWELLDEDISVAGMLRGVRPPAPRRHTV